MDHGIDFTVCWYVCGGFNPAQGAHLGGASIGPAEGTSPSSRAIRAGFGASATTRLGGDPVNSGGLGGCYYVCLGAYNGPTGAGVVFGAGTPGVFLY